MGIVIAIALIGAVFGKVLGEHVFSFIGLSDYIDAWNVIRWIVTSVTIFIALFILYTLLLKRTYPFKRCVMGYNFCDNYMADCIFGVGLLCEYIGQLLCLHTEVLGQ